MNREQELLNALRRMVTSEVVKEAPMLWYSEAYSDAKELLARIDQEPVTPTLQERHDALLRAARRLAMFSNRITGEHRHHGTVGQTFGDEEMVSLYDAQIIVEELTERGTGYCKDPVAWGHVMDAAEWLKNELDDCEPEAREFYAAALRDYAQKTHG